MMLLLLIYSVLSLQFNPSECKVCVITPSTAAVQSVVNVCTKNPNSTILFEHGNYQLSSIEFSNAVGLRIEIKPATTLKASILRKDYSRLQKDWYVLRLDNCTSCSISGGGTLDGQAQLWVDESKSCTGRKSVNDWKDPSCLKPTECRPRLLGILHSTDVSINNISLTDPIYWALHISNSSNIQVTGINIMSDDDIPNTDGIDIDSSSHVLISQSTIHTADDSVCIKTMIPNVPATNVLIQNCTVWSKSSAIKIGSESQADIKDIQIENIRILAASRALGIQLRDAGSIAGVVFQSIAIDNVVLPTPPSWWGAAEVISISSVPRNDCAPLGKVSHITLRDIVASRSENGIVVQGFEAVTSITNIIFESIKIDLYKLTNEKGGVIDLRPGGMQEDIGKLPAVWIDYAEGIHTNKVVITYNDPFREDWEEAVTLNNVGNDVDISGITLVEGSVLADDVFEDSGNAVAGSLVTLR